MDRLMHQEHIHAKKGKVYLFELKVIENFSKELIDFYSRLFNLGFYENKRIDVSQNLDFLEKMHKKYVIPFKNFFKDILPFSSLWLNILVFPIYQYYNRKSKSRDYDYRGYVEDLEKAFKIYLINESTFLEVSEIVREPLLAYLRDFYEVLNEDEEDFRKKIHSAGDPIQEIINYQKDIAECEAGLDKLKEKYTAIQKILNEITHSDVVDMEIYKFYGSIQTNLEYKMSSLEKRINALYDIIPTLDDQRFKILTSYSHALDHLQKLIHLLGGKTNDHLPLYKSKVQGSQDREEVA
ncbi:MAG: hypothetical protein GXN99_01355 [Candidatus Nanohaloarchaeota archaeon]|nr:hypothetical protein [Candidatus Nanohaloarchaeota archaeon]